MPTTPSHALTWRDALWLGAIVVIGINLRPLLTSISPLMTTIRDATGLSFYGASLLTSLPVVAMGIGAFGAGALTRSIGETRGVALGLLAIALACGARWSTASGAALLATAALAGVGVAAIQALLPAVMKQRFPARVPLAMGVFSASIMGGGGLGARLSPWVSAAMGSWHAGLAVWAIPALVALLCWLGLNRGPSHGSAAQRAPADAIAFSLWRKRRAWTLGLYFGIVNGGYTTLVAWLPAFYQQHGASVAESGSLLAGMTVFQAAAALLLPLAAAPFRDRRPWLIARIVGATGRPAWLDLLARCRAAGVGRHCRRRAWRDVLADARYRYGSFGTPQRGRQACRVYARCRLCRSGHYARFCRHGPGLDWRFRRRLGHAGR